MRRRLAQEDGAVAVTVALSMVLLVLMAGFVLDLGLARFDRQANQTAADLAATAAVQALDPDEPDAYRTACDAALDYFLANASDAAPVTGDPCAVFDDDVFTCATAGVAVTAVAGAVPYRVYVTAPVFEGDPLLAGQPFNAEVDGYDPCSRLGVRIERERDHLFAPVAGIGSSRPAAEAVARISADGTTPEYATLVVLDPNGCEVVRGDGGGIKLLIEDYTIDRDGDGDLETFPGIVTVDSNASECGSGKYLLNPNGNDGRICAGVDPVEVAPILAGGFCASTPDTLLTEADAAQVAAPADLSGGRVAPEPVTRGRITRQPIDHRYNCIDDYDAPGHEPSTVGRRQYPAREANDTAVQTCGSAGTRRAHVDDLVAAYGTLTKAEFKARGFTIIPDDVGHCSNANGLFPAGNYYVDCTSNQGFTIKSGNTVSFTSPGTIVFGGKVQVKGTLIVNAGAAADDVTKGLDTIVHVRRGGIDDTGGTATRLYRTFVYVEDGTINLQKAVTWEAPRDNPYDEYDDAGVLTEAGNCTYTSGAPQASCFQNLALWTNAYGAHDLAAQTGVELDGIFFTPNAGRDSNATFKLHGGPTFRLEHAQFFSYQLKLTGGSQLTMRPDPDRFEATPVVGGGLIR